MGLMKALRSSALILCEKGIINSHAGDIKNEYKEIQ